MPMVGFAANELANRINDAKPTMAALVAYSAALNRVAWLPAGQFRRCPPPNAKELSRRGLSPGNHEIGDVGMIDDEGVGGRIRRSSSIMGVRKDFDPHCRRPVMDIKRAWRHRIL
jgi:hypothetical protein